MRISCIVRSGVATLLLLQRVVLEAFDLSVIRFSGLTYIQQLFAEGEVNKNRDKVENHLVDYAVIFTSSATNQLREFSLMTYVITLITDILLSSRIFLASSEREKIVRSSQNIVP